MTASDIRASFLDFFAQRGHRIVASSPLVPADDPTLLFTNAGMNQFKDTFLGREKREYTRAATAQKCMRVSGKHNDLDTVGPSFSHHTFFEMLGNFSFGDYFKAEAIPMAWALLVDVWKLPPDRLTPTIFRGEGGVPRDDEAFDVWRQFLPAARIGELGTADNFWQMGEVGPCGRCSEIYYVRGSEIPCAAEASGSGCRGVECSCNRYVEIWNNVFMEYDRQADGSLKPLPARSIDTGMGLERVTSVIQGRLSTYDTDVFAPLLAAIAKRTGHTHLGTMGPADISTRIVADHMRAMTFLIGDGVIPSNEWRGYVLRKIMRRAMRHGKHLGVEKAFLHTLVDVIDQQMGAAYPEIRTNREMIEKTILAEEHRFDAVLRDGLPRLEAALETARSEERALPGDVAFRLYDTFGVPFDFIEDTAATSGVAIDRAGYDAAMEAQRAKARAQSAFGGGKGDDFTIDDDASLRAVGDQFDGYTSTRGTGLQIVALFDADRQPVTSLAEGQRGYVILTRTPFYVESGGQVSDAGRLLNEATGAVASVDGLARTRAGLPRAHHVRVTSGALHERDLVTAEVDVESRDATRRNHTATHLLHAALRQILGTHVKQAGSLVAPDRLRFDFVHFQALTPAEVLRIERIVNEAIVRNRPVQTDVRSTEEAIAAGAMALFGEKYGDRVRVVTVPGVSIELCGGTHVAATGDIGAFIITAESGVAAGVRRVEALTGLGALTWIQERRESLQQIVAAIQAPEDQAVEAIGRMQQELKRLGREVSQLKTKLAMGGGAAAGAVPAATEVAGVKLARRRVAGLDKDALRGLADSLKASLGSGVVVIASENDGKVQIVVSVTSDLTRRLEAGQIVREIAPLVGGRGGGRPDFAEAGGRDASRIDAMLAAAEGVVGELLKA